MVIERRLAQLPEVERERWEARHIPKETPRAKSGVHTDWPPDDKLIRGYRIGELLRNDMPFSDMVFLSLFGRLPNEKESRMFNALLVSSNCGTFGATEMVAARNIWASSQVTNAALAGGVLALGGIHGGANEDAGRMIQEYVRRMRAQRLSHAEMAKIVIEEHRAAQKRIPGIGHHYYPVIDPRIPPLFELAEELGFASDHVKLYQEIEKAIPKTHRANLIINSEGAAVAIVCDMLGDDYDYRASNVWWTVGRFVSIGANLLEWMQRGDRHDLRVAWDYDGPPPRELPREYLARLSRRD